VTKGKKIIVYTVLTISSFVSVFPLYWMFAAATNKSVDVARGRLLPGGELINNFRNLVAQYDLGSAMTNSFKYAISLTLIAMFICSLAGYGFEIYHSKAKDRLMSVLLLAMMIPFAAVMIPLYRFFAQLGLLNSVLGFILPSIATPHDIMEAARMDGLNEFQIFCKIFIPTMKSTYAAAMTITFMGAWNSYLWPKVIMTNAQTITMPMLVANLKEGYVTDYGMLMLTVLLCTLPTAGIFFILQKNFVEGITGAVK